jgi:hypothetical protein
MVVVLGVMYPDYSSRHSSKVTMNDVPRLPPGVAGVVFYDPISSTEPNELTPQDFSGEYRTARQELRQRNMPKRRKGSRAEAIEAVVHDLTQLSWRNKA